MCELLLYLFLIETHVSNAYICVVVTSQPYKFLMALKGIIEIEGMQMTIDHFG